MKKTNWVRGSALATAVAIVTMTAAPAWAAPVVATANASAVTLTGALDGLLDTGTHTAECDAAEFDENDLQACEVTEGSTNVSLPAAGVAYQEATAGLSDNGDGTYNGVSSAESDIASVDLTSMGNLDLTDTLDAVFDIDDVLGLPIGGILGLLEPLEALLGPITDFLVAPVDDILQGVLGSVTDALPISAEIGAVTAECSAIPGEASGNGSVAGITLNIGAGVLPGNGVDINIPINTAPNSPLLVGDTDAALGQIVDGLLDGLTDSIGNSLDGALSPLVLAISGLRTALIDSLLGIVEDTLLQALRPLLDQILTGTVNKQTSDGAGHIEVTALELNVLPLADLANLELARVECGFNSAFDPEDPEEPVDPEDPDPEVPTVIDAGSQQNALLAAAGLLAALGLVGASGYSVIRLRR